mmetsp:Transcript_29712/g.41421  ORF Transcript_29712/g.41421 Transcript_29712/m.41421 type:complete len:166 (+) Transcript_29712:370-867(+)
MARATSRRLTNGRNTHLPTTIGSVGSACQLSVQILSKFHSEFHSALSCQREGTHKGTSKHSETPPPFGALSFTFANHHRSSSLWSFQSHTSPVCNEELDDHEAEEERLVTEKRQDLQKLPMCERRLIDVTHSPQTSGATLVHLRCVALPAAHDFVRFTSRPQVKH